jgi:serine/threonine protein kinase
VRRRIIALLDIVTGLKKIHEKGLLHRNLHIGNLVVFRQTVCIIDIGLCKPANYKELNNTENSVYGVLPYVAPEILRGQPYTKESDIYSFGIIMYEIISGMTPYHGIEHNEYLAKKICEGLRPRLNVNVPQLILHLIKRCLDANPSNRPNVKDLSTILHEWLNEIKKHNKDKTESTKTELIKQIEESVKINDSSSAFISLPLANRTHSAEDIYTSKLLNFNNLPEPKNPDDYYERYDNISSVEY